MPRVATVVLACGCLAAGPAHGQPTGRDAGTRTFAAVRDGVAQADGVGAQEIRLHWLARSPRMASQPAIEDLQIVDRRAKVGRVRKERHPELSAEKLVVVATDLSGKELDWRIVADPRLIRGEVADSRGNLTGQPFRRIEADLLVTIPDRPEIRRLRLYEPRWTGGEFVLDLLGTVDLP
jgi:hypothetical protein